MPMTISGSSSSSSNKYYQVIETLQRGRLLGVLIFPKFWETGAPIWGWALVMLVSSYRSYIQIP